MLSVIHHFVKTAAFFCGTEYHLCQIVFSLYHVSVIELIESFSGMKEH